MKETEQSDYDWQVPVVPDRHEFFEEESRFADPPDGHELPRPDDPEAELAQMREEAARRTGRDGPG